MTKLGSIGRELIGSPSRRRSNRRGPQQHHDGAHQIRLVGHDRVRGHLVSRRLQRRDVVQFGIEGGAVMHEVDADRVGDVVQREPRVVRVGRDVPVGP